MLKSRPKIIVILGPTATGKTKLAVKLASIFNGEIISADSRQVYKGMTIGTGKDLADYRLQTPNAKHQTPKKSQAASWRTNSKLQTRRIPYHLIDIVSPRTDFNVAKWLKLAHGAIADIVSRGKVPFVVGGTGLYISALVEGYNLAETKPNLELRKKLDKETLTSLLYCLRKLDPVTYKKIDKKNKRRVVRAVEVCLAPLEGGQALRRSSTLLTAGGSGQALDRFQGEGHTFARLRGGAKPLYDFLILGVKKPREEINKLIGERVETRLKQGMIEEVEKLHHEGVSWKRLLSFGLEYKWISKYLKKEVSREEMTMRLKIAIHQFAKRQMTWFRKMRDVQWVGDYREALKVVRRWFDG